MPRMENATSIEFLLNNTNSSLPYGNSSVPVVNLNASIKNYSAPSGNSSAPVLSKYYPFLATELGLSILCSVLLILVYVRIGEHRTLPGKNVITISLCLIITYILLIVDLVMRNRIPRPICATMGVTVQTAFLATFFWTNVMSFDIMQTMASVKSESLKTSKFWKYSAYAWTMTLICVIPAVAIDCSDLVPMEFKPKFGVKKCWLNGQVAFYVYFNLPVGLTLAANCIFFAITARTIVKVRSATAILATNRHKKRYRLCMKLVLIMGLVWITEFIPWLTGIYWMYAIAGMLNCLHGVYLFIIFVCKRRTFKQLTVDFVCPCSKTTPPTVANKKSPSIDTVMTTISS